METGHFHFGDVVKSTLPRNESLARENLRRINPGSDGLESMRYARCPVEITEANHGPGVPRLVHHHMDRELATRDCPLFRLNKNIRRTIYAYVMTYTDPIPIHEHLSHDTWYDSKGECLVRETWRFTPALLRTCRWVHEEATPVFYANNTFTGTIRNSDISEITGWVDDTDDAHLAQVKEFVLTIEPTSFADLLDMNTAEKSHAICRQARRLANALSKTSIASPQIELPPLKHLRKDGAMLDLEEHLAEQMRSRWVLELGSAFKKLDDDNSLVKKMKAFMIKVRQAGNNVHGKSLSGA